MTQRESTDQEIPATADYALDWLNDPERLLAKARAEPDALEAYFHALDASHAFRTTSLFDGDALILAIADTGSCRLLDPTGAEAPDIAYEIDWDAVRAIQRQGGVKLVEGHVDSSDASVIVYVAAQEASYWDLPEAVAQALNENPAERALVIAAPAIPERPLRRACRSFGMSGLETRIIEASLREGNIRRAAAAMEISYTTARAAISSALAKSGARRIPGLLYRLSLLAFGVFPAGDAAPAILVDRWGLKPRQAQIAMLLAQGMTRAETARALSLSEATVKKQTDIVFQTLGVSSAAEMARSISIATVAQALVSASHGRMSWLDSNAEPLRILHSDDGRRIAISEYGHPKGRPLVILHSSMTTRHPPRHLVAKLVDAGFRVLAIDRPGFGLTDPSPTPAGDGDADPFAAAAHDMATVFDTLRIARADIVGRGGAQAAVAFAGLYPERCGKVVLVNPDPISARDERRWGVLGSFKEAYRQRPGLILPAARLLARAMTREYLGKALQKAMRGSPPDEAALENEQVIDDYYRAVRMLATGRLEGYVREQIYFARGKTVDYPVNGADWSVLIGAHDTLSNPASVRSYWEEILPQAEFETLPEHGRLLAYADPELIVRRLTA
jgi:pimeloyl-ACP methyl ester carboxylesterase/DNA-binding CsgD family transcriptional regulator/molybdenum-dependent DNA-binding transcriptional regulator ModE